MRAIILAASRGLPLQQPEDRQLPTSLLRFGGKRLLERHLTLLRSTGMQEIVLALGFRRQLIENDADDVARAAREILPSLQSLTGAAA